MKSTTSIKRTIKTTVAGMAIAASTLTALPAFAAGEVYIPIPSYRVGPYAAGGTGYFGGILDYYNLQNEKGGVGGTKLTWSECETEYTVERGVECYRRMKDRGQGAIFFDPLSVGISTALIEAGRQDKIPIISINHGKTEAQDGEVFPFQFPLGNNTYDQYSILSKFMAHLVSGEPADTADRNVLKGKKLVTLYHGSPYGKEAHDYIDRLAEKYGFTHEKIEVAHPGNEQQAQWLQIRRSKPDFVNLVGWGIMNPVAMQTAVRTGFPVNRLIGNIWSSSDEDVIPAGDAADGYQAITGSPAGTESPILQTLIKEVYDKGKGNLEDKSRIGSAYHNLGVLAGMVHVEAMRTAQKRWGDGPVNAEQMRWGFENLKLDDARLAELEGTGLMPPMVTTCKDHVGGHTAKYQKWDAKKRQWSPVTDWITGDPELVLAVVEEKAAVYKKENNIEDRDCNNAEDRDNWKLSDDLKKAVPEGVSTWEVKS